MVLNCDDDDFSQGHSHIEEAFKVLTTDDVLQPNISDNHFRSSIVGNDIGYKLYVFDKIYQKNLQSAQPIQSFW